MPDKRFDTTPKEKTQVRPHKRTFRDHIIYVRGHWRHMPQKGWSFPGYKHTIYGHDGYQHEVGKTEVESSITHFYENPEDHHGAGPINVEVEALDTHAVVKFHLFKDEDIGWGGKYGETYFWEPVQDISSISPSTVQHFGEGGFYDRKHDSWDGGGYYTLYVPNMSHPSIKGKPPAEIIKIMRGAKRAR